MVSANEILNYRGNPDDALATGGGPWGVAQGGITSTASRDLALAALGRNKQMYEQRIADRDKVFKLIDDDALIPKDILDQDRPRIDGKLKDIEDTFFNYNGDILSDPARYREYISKIQSAKADIAQAAKRYIAVNAENEAGLKDNPTDLADRKAYIQNYLNDKDGFYKTYSPYVKMNSFDLNVVHPKPTYGEDKTSFTKDKDGHWKVTENTLDVPKLFGNLRAAYADKDKNFMFTNSKGHGYIDELLGHPNADKYVDGINKGIDKYNADLGLKKGDANYVSHVDDQLIKNPDNSYRLAYPGAAPDVAGKMVVAENEAKTTKREPVSELNTYDLGKGRLGEEIRHNKATEGEAYQRLKFDKDKWDTQMKGDKSVKNGASLFAKRIWGEMEDIGGKMANGNIIITPDQARKMTNEQRKYMGISQPGEKDKTTGKEGPYELRPLDLAEGDAIELDKNTGAIRVLKNAERYTKTDGTVGWRGDYDNTRSSSFWNVATNKLNEELKNAGNIGELNSYLNTDIGRLGVNESGGGKDTRTRGSSSSKNNLSTDVKDWTDMGNGTWKYKDGSVYNANGEKIK